jgi:hypothetical protein
MNTRASGKRKGMETERTYCVYNQTREAFLSFNVSRADTTFARLRGLLGKFRMRSDEGIWLVPAYSIHTFGLFFSIDVIYLDIHDRVIHLVEHLRPFRFGPIRFRSATVLQFPPHTIYASGTKIGDQLLIALPQDIKGHLNPQVEPQSRRRASAAR